jgi:hypothetical protein
MPTADYNGWPNRATWNTHLWLTNSPWAYRVAREVALRPATIEDAAWALEDICRQGWGDETPDGDRLDLVDWPLVASALREP